MTAAVYQPRILDAPAVNTKGKPNAERRRTETKRIDAIVELDKRHKMLLTAGDRDGLDALAKEYKAMGMPNTASQIRAEAGNL